MEKDLFEELSTFDLNYNNYLGDKFIIEKANASSRELGIFLRTNRYEYYCIKLIYKEYSSQGPSGEGANHLSIISLVEKGETGKDISETHSRYIKLYFSQHYLDSENLPWNDYLNRVFINNNILLNDVELKDFHNYFSLVLYEYQKNDSCGPSIIADLLMIIFKMVINCGETTTITKELPAARSTYFRFKTLIDQHFREHHDVQTYADQLNMSKEMLGKIVRETANKTPKQLIDERLITAAKKLLAWTTITNKEIAYDLGFESDSYFNRYFKKHCDQTPLSFRLHHQSDQSVKYP